MTEQGVEKLLGDILKPEEDIINRTIQELKNVRAALWALIKMKGGTVSISPDMIIRASKNNEHIFVTITDEGGVRLVAAEDMGINQ